MSVLAYCTTLQPPLEIALKRAERTTLRMTTFCDDPRGGTQDQTKAAVTPMTTATKRRHDNSQPHVPWTGNDVWAFVLGVAQSI